MRRTFIALFLAGLGLSLNAHAEPNPPRDVVVDAVVAEGAAGPLPVHVGGRVATDGHGYTYQWPGVYFETRFKGPFVALAFDDDANAFNVILDGKPYMVLRRPGETSVSINVNDDAVHTVRVEKRSETQYAVGSFHGFAGRLPAPEPAPLRTRQIEFIGDSFTVGYGNTSAFTQCTPEEIFETTDAQQGFGPLVARHFDADYQINAFSGLGMVRNFGGFEHPKYRLPMLYRRAIFDDPTPVRPGGWHPQIIVIGIGGNDFSTPLSPTEPWADTEALVADYVTTYSAFIAEIRTANPKAFIILAAPEEPGTYRDAVTAVFDAIKSAGEARVDLVLLPALERTGCNGHPNVRDDARIAGLYTDYIKARPDLWAGR